LPVAENVDVDLPEGAPTIAVTRGEVLLDGQRVDDTRAFEGNTTLHTMDGEFAALKAQREAWKVSHPGERLPGVVLLRFEASLPVAVVKSVFQTAAFAAYPNASFLVRIAGSDRVGHVVADAHVPAPPEYMKPPADAARRLDVAMEAGRFVLTWRAGDAVESTSTAPRREVVTRDAFGEVVRYPDLAGAITVAWKARGAHRDEGDRALDQLGIHVDDRAPFQLLVAMLDAANAPKRDIALAGQRVRVPVFNVTLYVR
jgi:hypothetical protein